MGEARICGAPTYASRELNLILARCPGNPHPILAGGVRKGDDLFTCSIVAIHADTGKLAWYFQPSPHDTHDWDAIETPVLVDGDFHGAKRKMLLQASRNGYFFVLDRETGKNLLTTPFVETDWASQIPIWAKTHQRRTSKSRVSMACWCAQIWMEPLTGWPPVSIPRPGSFTSMRRPPGACVPGVEYRG